MNLYPTFPFQIFIKEKCKLKNGDDITPLEEVFNLFKNHKILIILDLKDQLTEFSIKKILEVGIPITRLKLTAFYPDFLKHLNSSNVLSKEQIDTWNSISRYENFRHPVFGQTSFNKNFHLFSAFAYAQFNSDDQHFGAWEVNYPIFLNWILPKNPEFIVTKNPTKCMQIRDNE